MAVQNDPGPTLWRTWPTGTLVAIYLAAILLALNYGGTYLLVAWRVDEIERFAFVLLITWQVSLLALWVALGPTASRYRIPVAIVLSGQIYFDKAIYRHAPEAIYRDEWRAFLDVHCLAHLVGTVILLSAATARMASPATSLPSVTADTWRPRFRIHHLLICTAIAALVTGLWSLVQRQVSPLALQTFAAAIAGGAASALLNSAAVRGCGCARPARLTRLAALAIVLGLTLNMAWFTAISETHSWTQTWLTWESVWRSAAFMLVQAALVALSLLVLRGSVYRVNATPERVLG